MIVVLADDLTGAAEIGGIAWWHGLTAEIQHELDTTAGVDLVILNTNSRFSSLSDSARRVNDVAGRCRAAGIGQVFIKVDSVLRGHVLTDLTAAMSGFGCKRALLAPANPNLGRTIDQGVYRVDGAPLDETQFAHDPDFPATTALVIPLLQQHSGDPVTMAQPVTVQTPGADLPHQGIIVGEATHGEDLAYWVTALDATILPAGAAEFFAVYLVAQGHNEAKSDLPLAPCPSSVRLSSRRSNLFVCGSASTATKQFCRQSEASGVPVLSMPQTLFDGTCGEEDKLLAEWADAAVQALKHSQRTVIAINRPIEHTPGGPERLTQLFSAVAARILSAVNVEEIFVEGGATAASVIDMLGWSRLRVEEELAPGVVCTRPVDTDGPLLTMKPGSYVWPAQVLSDFSLTVQL